MDSYAQDILNLFKSLTDKEKAWKIPPEYQDTLMNCSLQLEKFYEFRYLRLNDNENQIKEYVAEDTYFKNHFQDEYEFLHTSLWLIDNFHVGVAGFEHIFFSLATQYLFAGVRECSINHLFNPDTHKFDPDQDPLPPMIFHEIDSAGNIHSSRGEFDRDDPISAEWNFYNGLHSQRAEQRERFWALLRKLEPDNYYFDDEDETDEDWLDGDDEVVELSYDNRAWDDPENEPILATLEEVKPVKGRPSNTDQDDTYALLYSKILMTRYFGNDRGKVPSRRSCILKVADFLGIAEHNKEAFIKRIDKKLKRKMSLRILEQ